MDRKHYFTKFQVVDSDVDGLREHYAKTLKPVEVYPAHGKTSISVDDLHFSMGEFDIWAGTCQSGMEVKFSESPDAYAIYLPLSGLMQFDLAGKRVSSEPGTLLVCDMAQMNQISLQEHRSHIGIAFSKRALTQQLSSLIEAPVLSDIAFTEQIDVLSGSGNKLASMCQLLWENLAGDPQNSIMARSNEHFIQALMVTLLESVPHRYTGQLQGHASTPVPRHVKRAIDFMNSEIGRQITIDEIAASAGVSVRTLQLAFQEFKDVTPLNFLRQMRLEGARRELAEKRDRHGSIADVARRWGFTHMGRFAALYREAFGEPPRDTFASRLSNSISQDQLM